VNRFTRSTPPRTAAQLKASEAALKVEIPALEDEERDVQAALADLVGDPAYEDVEARARELRFVIPTKRDTLARIQAAIPKAEKREELEAYKVDVADLERRTNKAARTIEARYTAAAGALADVLKEMAENELAWSRIGDRARDLGIDGTVGHNVEFRLRREFTCGIRGFQSLHTTAKVDGWNGRPLFVGGSYRYR
jgi:DNA repair exonuclease SbcCD ATPase subunit